MKKTYHLILLLVAFALTFLASQGAYAQVMVPFGVSYALTNYPASLSTNADLNLASGVWLGNLRGNLKWRDLIVANKGSNTVSIRLCNDNGTFRALTNFAVGDQPTGVRSARLNADIFEDVIVANSGTNTVSILRNLNGVSFAPATNYVVGLTGTPEPVAVAANDVTGDGLLDILVANANENTVSALINDGLDGYVLWTNFSVGTRPVSVGTADLNNDGLWDIFTANKTAGTLTVLIRTNDSAFAAPQTITLFAGGNPQPVQALAADIDGDDLTDIVTVNYASNTVSILKGPGFAVTTNYSVGSAPSGLLLRDLNRDSMEDITVVNSGDNSVTILINSGDGTFEAGPVKSVGSNPAAIAGSNFDTGGFTDIAVANNGDNTVSILVYDMPLSVSQSVIAYEDQNKSIVIGGTAFGSRPKTYNVTVQPTNGTLSGTAPNVIYLSDTNAWGIDHFAYVFDDGVNTSEVATVTLDVRPVNDRPTFVASTNRIVVTKLGVLVTVTNFATALNRGAPDESWQRLTFPITVTNSAFFATRPAIGTNFNLTFKASLLAGGTNVIFVPIVDNGGTANGGVNFSTGIPVEIVVPTNPFLSIGGSYNGLFHETNQINNDSSGYFNLTITSAGVASGRIILKKVYPFSTHFFADGSTQFSISRGTNLPPLAVSLQLDTTNGTDQIFGTVSDGSWTATLIGDRGTFNVYTNLAPQTGSYTMFLDGSTNGLSPAGQGYAVVKVSSVGKISLTGKLADGTAISQSAVLSKNGIWPLYISRYNGNGSLLGWISFVDETGTDFTGDISWIKTGAAGGTRYPAGFTNEPAVIGSTYIVPDISSPVLSLTNAVSVLSGGGLTAPLTNTMNFLLSTGGDAKQLSFTINVNNGFLSGSFLHPVTKLKTGISGAVFQKSPSAGGFFLRPTESGAFVLTPP
jgi:hypothetical protein